MDKQEKTQVSSMKEPTVETQVPSAKEPTVETQVPSSNELAVAPSLQSILDKACESYLHRDYGVTMSLTGQIIKEALVDIYVEALYLRGKCLYYGNGCDRNLDEAELLLFRASELAYRKAQNLLGVLYAHRFDRADNFAPTYLSKAFSFFDMAADDGQGDPEAMVNEGICYFWGLGTEQNLERAVYFFERAASRGNTSGEVILSLCYIGGIGVERNPERGFKLLDEITGDITADCLLECCYLFGIGIEQNLEHVNQFFTGAQRFGVASEDQSDELDL